MTNNLIILITSGFYKISFFHFNLSIHYKSYILDANSANFSYWWCSVVWYTSTAYYPIIAQYTVTWTCSRNDYLNSIFWPELSAVHCIQTSVNNTLLVFVVWLYDPLINYLFDVVINSHIEERCHYHFINICKFVWLSEERLKR